MLVLWLALGLVAAVDDSTMSSLLANVDPLPMVAAKSSLIQAEPVQNAPLDDSYISVRGIQSPSALKKYQMRSSSNPILQRRIHVAPRIHHLVESGAVAREGKISTVPEILLCPLPAKANGLSVRTCDLAGPSGALLSQVLRCSDRIHPNTIVDIFTGRQTAPINLSQDETIASASIGNMETPISVDVSFGACNQDRSTLPDLDISSDYLALIMLNPDVERAAENFSALAGAAARAFKAGIVFVSVRKMFEDAVNLKGIVATGFSTDVGDCMKDGICTASELVEWTRKGPSVDYLVGASSGTVRLDGAFARTT